MVTLTYDDQHLPVGGSLCYPDFQRFMRRVRKSFRERVRFYMAGEYGERTFRPHFHALLFGVDFPDREFLFFSGSGAKIFKSSRLSGLWPFGFSSVGDVTFESAAYVARYVMKKITGDAAAEHYRRVDLGTGEVFQLVPEFNRMSLKPGIGGLWLDRFQADVFPHDRVVVRGREGKPPKYYFRRLEKMAPEVHARLLRKRRRDMARGAKDRTPERLAAREVVAAAQVKMLRRSVE